MNRAHTFVRWSIGYFSERKFGEMKLRSESCPLRVTERRQSRGGVANRRESDCSKAARPFLHRACMEILVANLSSTSQQTLPPTRHSPSFCVCQRRTSPRCEIGR